MERFVPEFELADAQGRPAGTRPLLRSQREDLVLVRLHEAGCAECDALGSEIERRARAGLPGAVRLEVLRPGGSAPSGDGVEYLRDDGGRQGERVARAAGLGAEEACVVVADRYGELASAARAHGAPAQAVLGDALDEVEYLQRRCPECGAPTW